MRFAICLAAAFALWDGGVRGAQSPPSTSKTVWDGAYTDGQAKRGEAVYAAECSSCHGEDLSGQQSRLMHIARAIV